MKGLLFYIVFSVIPVTEALCIGISETNNGIYIVVAADSSHLPFGLLTNEPIPSDAILTWYPYSKTGLADIHYPDPIYGIKLKLVDPDGKEVTKTALGQTFGSRFESVRTFDDALGHKPMPHVEACEKYDPTNPGFPGKSLPKPDELFRIEKPGVYTLEMQMIVFRTMSVRNAGYLKLLEFDHIRIKVEKTAAGK